MSVIIPQKGFEYIRPGNPTVDVNPPVKYVTWLNLTTGEIFVCKDNTPEANKWIGQINGEIVSLDGLILDCTMTNISDNTLVDETGLHDGIISGATTVPSGQSSQALKFNGSSNSVSFGQIPLTFPFTLLLWVASPKPARGSWEEFASSGNDNTNRRFYLRPNKTTGVIEFGCYTSGVGIYLVSPNAMPENEWNHLAVTITSSKAILYRNGLPIASQEDSFGSLVGYDSHFSLGCLAGSSSEYFLGKLKRLRLFTRELSASEILASYNREVGL